MILWEREKQCQNCYYEYGYDEAQEILADGTVLYEHRFDCRIGNKCESDIECPDYIDD